MKEFSKMHEEEILKTPRMRLVNVNYMSDDGEEICHTIVRSKPSVAVIIINERKEIAFIKQFRTTTGKWYYEIPAGMIEKGETIIQAAAREAMEEAGLKIKNALPISYGENLLDPSKSDESFGVVKCNLDDATERSLDEQEVIEKKVEWVPIKDVFFNMFWELDAGIDFKDGLYMSGHSAYALLVYFFLKNYSLDD